MSKISKVIFVQKEQAPIVKKENKVVVEKPIVVSKIEIQSSKHGALKEKKDNKVDNLKPLFYRNFPIKDWAWYLDFAKKANKEIGKGLVVTLSKKAFVKGVQDLNQGSIYYSCGSKDFKEHFRKPLEIELCLFGLELRRINKSELKKLSCEFYILWQEENCKCDLTNCCKINDSSTNLDYCFSGENNEYYIPYSEINNNGSGVIKYEDGFIEEFSFYVKSNIENI